MRRGFSAKVITILSQPLLLIAVACSSSPKSPNVAGEASPRATDVLPAVPQTEEASASSAPKANVADSLARPMVLSLRRDSLHLPAGVTNDQVKAAVDSAIATLRRVHDFEILAVSAPILSAKIRPLNGETSAAIVKAIGRHPLVAELAVDALISPPGGGGTP